MRRYLGGTLLICLALAACRRGVACRNMRRARDGCCGRHSAIVCYLLAAVRGTSAVCRRPKSIVRERPSSPHIEMTRRAYALDRIETHRFPRKPESSGEPQ